MRLLFLLSLRNLTSHRVKNLIVGALLSFGAFLWVVGITLSQNIENEMRRSISSSLTGDLQIYDSDARDPLSLFGGFSVGAPDVGQIPHFEQVRDAISPLPGVKALIPMGILIGSVTVQGELENALGELREWIWLRIQHQDLPRSLSEYPVERVQRALQALYDDMVRSSRILSKDIQAEKAQMDVLAVLDASWWADFPGDPWAKLEYLDTKIAPFSPPGQMVYLRVLGTDMMNFQNAFSRMRVLRGRRMEAGERGMMLNQQFMDEHMKIRALRTLDQIYQAVTEQGKSISSSPELKNKVSQLERQSAGVASIIAREDEADVDEILSGVVGIKGTVREKLTRFFQIDDDNIQTRYEFFYRQIAPRIKVYTFDHGDLVPLTAFTKAGYPRSVNVRIRGVFTFEGLEKSELAGATNLIDMVTFRDLYGQPSAAERRELADMRKSAGIELVPKAAAEKTLFSTPEVEFRQQEETTLKSEHDFSIIATRRNPDDKFAQDEVEKGLALHAAVLLEEDTEPDEMAAKIQRVSDEKQLNIQVIDWRGASGLVGQFVLVVRFVIYIALWIILAVAIVIMNNTLVISTLDRVHEIGTLRALGAQKRFVRWTTMVESFFLATIAALAGISGAVLFLYILQQVGIPAQSNVWIFLFGGPRLYPEIYFGPLVGATILLLTVSQIATFYPAYLATRIPPIVAMQDEQT